ncbi:GntR family transcriptional regulator [Hansschlegelia zhihuaiae]|nr:GntR family transcriptional regulator [Hansschlegelia zhihuaiae]
MNDDESAAGRPPKTGRTLEALRRDIGALALAPGAKLATVALAARYGVGQAPVREALSILAGEGLVLRESRRGFRVAPMSLAALDELTETRVTLELAFLSRAIAAGDGGWKTRVRRALDLLLPALQLVGDSRRLDPAWEEAHRRFHFALIGADEAATLFGLSRALYDRYDRYRLAAVPRRAFLAGIADDHAEIAEAALAGDAIRASAVLRRHIEDASRTLRDNIVALGLAVENGQVRLPLA